jgi:hypothetical protein
VPGARASDVRSDRGARSGQPLNREHRVGGDPGVHRLSANAAKWAAGKQLISLREVDTGPGRRGPKHAAAGRDRLSEG